jgi:DNA-binding NarL/FixJ family response regulator
LIHKDNPARRILIVGNGAMLEQGVENLLTQEPNVHVWTVNHENEGAFIQDVLGARPDVILFHETDELDSGRIFDLLKFIPIVDSLRVIILRSSSAAIDLYDRRRVNAANSRDLLSLVLSDGRAEAS